MNQTKITVNLGHFCFDTELDLFVCGQNKTLKDVNIFKFGKHPVTFVHAFSC